MVTDTQTHTDTYGHTQTHAHTQTHPNTHPDAHTHSHTHTHRHIWTHTDTCTHTDTHPDAHTHTLLGVPSTPPFPLHWARFAELLSFLCSIASQRIKGRRGTRPHSYRSGNSSPGRRFTWRGLGLWAVGRRTCAPLQGGQNPQSGMGRPGRVSRNLSTGPPSLPSVALCMGSGEGTPQSGQDLRAWERHRGWG